MVRAFIGLGSNLGHRRANLERALALLSQAQGVTVCRVSAFIETEPVGGPPQGTFLNAAAELETDLEPRTLLNLLLDIEDRMGRLRGERWGPRIIDLDLLICGDSIVAEEGLQVPHPRMHERGFVLAPLAEIAPDAVHPVLAKTIAQLLAEAVSHHRGAEDAEGNQLKEGLEAERYPERDLTEAIIGAAIEVHRILGPGLLESAYEAALCRELALRGIHFERQKDLPVEYKGVGLDAAYRVDVVVEGRVILEIKSVEAVAPVHEAQLLTYLRLSGMKVGLLLNFNVAALRKGIRRFVV